MQVVRGWQDVPASARGAVLAIGNFDGVHRGHRTVIARGRAIAAASGKKSGAVVFEPHPRLFFEPDRPFFCLTPLPVKLELLQQLGLDETFVIPFDADLANLSADAFVRQVIAAGLGADHLVVGHDFTYGKGRTGSTEELTELGRLLGFGVDVVAPVGEAGEVLSSSRVREHLRRGEVRQAAEILGDWWRVQGSVAAGAGRGKGLGFPTLNLLLAPGQDLAHGIYAVRVSVDGQRHDAGGYLGDRPTFGGGPPILEAYLFDFTGNLYDKTVEVEFIERIRPDRSFASPEELASQMERDCAQIAAILARTGTEPDLPPAKAPS